VLFFNSPSNCGLIMRGSKKRQSGKRYALYCYC
jgi:hypothetical protein